MVKLFMVNASLLILASIVYGQSSKTCSTPAGLRAANFFKQRIDTSVNPCDNFYKFACGKWIENTEIQPEYQLVSTYHEIQKEVDVAIKDLLEKPYDAAKEKNYIKLLKEYHAQCTDVDAIDNKGIAPLVDLLKSVGEWPQLSEQWSSDNFDLIERTLKLKEKGIYQSSYLLKIDVSYIPGDISANAFYVRANKLFMLGVENYRSGLESELVKYESEALLKIASALGVEEKAAAEDIQKMQELKVRLANVMDSDNEQVLMSLDELSALAPNVEWKKFIEGLTDQTMIENEKIVVNQPQNIKEVNNVLATADKRTLANLMMYNVIAVFGEYVGKEIRDVVLGVRGKVTGIDENSLPRWKVCLMDKADVMGVALSSLYLINNNAPSKRAAAIDLFELIRSSYEKSLSKYELFNTPNAAKKIHTLKRYILHPDQYLKQSTIQDYYDELNFDDAPTILDKQFKISHLQQQKMYRTLREKHQYNWENFDYALDVGFEYYPQENAAKMTEATFNEPLFGENRPNYLNFGTVGFMMAHLFAHAFDTEARFYDANGKPWKWDADADEQYNKRVQCFVDMYDKFDVNGVNVNGSRTVNENLADVVGMSLAFHAYKEITGNNEEAALEGLPYSPDQLFWISSANVFCAKYRDEYMAKYVKTNTHSPPEFRVNGAVMNSNEFAKVFQCSENSAMNPKNKCF